MVEFKNSYTSNISFNEKNSLNAPSTLLVSENTDNINKDYSYARRIGRVVTVNDRAIMNNKFHKVIIPYDFDKKKYIIKMKEIEFYEHKNYFIRKLDYFCNMKVFNIDNQYEPTCCEKFIFFLVYLIIGLIVAYVLFTIATLFSYNLFVLYTALNWFRKGFLRIRVYQFVLMEKWKIKAINKVLYEENRSEFCTKNKLKWILGQSGYWIEIQKLLE
jgi:hypothetical protein